MRPDRPLQVLIALTIAVSVACVTAIGERGRGADAEPATGGPVAPRLAARDTAVAVVELRHGGRHFALERLDGGWVNRGLGGFPALGARVEQMVAALAALQYFAPRTARAPLHAKLQVEDDAPGARSTRVTLKDPSGVVLVDLIIGRQNLNVMGLGRQGVYVRRPGEARAWLALGRLEVSGDPLDWSDRVLVDIAPSAVQSLRIVHDDGEVLALARSADRQHRFVLREAGGDGARGQPAQLAYLAGIAENLTFDDAVREEAFASPLSREVVVESVDGLVVALAVTPPDAGGRVWASVAARRADGVEASGQDAEVRRIREHCAGWVFRLPLAVAHRLSLRRPDVVDSPG